MKYKVETHPNLLAEGYEKESFMWSVGDIIEEINRDRSDGWLDFDVIVTMPSVMSKIGALGKVLGPRGLMPNPKSGTVTQDIGKAVTDVKKGKIDSAKVLAEFQSVDGFNYELGQKFDSSIFNIGEMINVRSKSKGKGFAGVIKRHGFRRQPATHGTKHTERAGGSIRQASWPSRVFKGLKMAGRLGNAYNTTKNLEIVNIDKEKNLLYVKGSIAGANNAIVFILKK